MQKIFLAVILSSLLFACDIRNNGKKDVQANKQTKQAFNDSTTVEIIDSTYNFGKVTDGEKVEYNYRFKNTGKHPLVILTATASCGCTVPEKPEEPIKPGETGFLKVVFNSQGRVGDVHKEITVTSNAYPAFPILQLRGEVAAANK
jgi:hypothetical protein